MGMRSSGSLIITEKASDSTVDSPVYDLLHRRAKLQAQFQRDSSKLDQEEEIVHQLLFDLVPDDLKQWVMEEDLVGVILKQGGFHIYIWFGGPYGFGTHKDIVNQMSRLSEVWKEFLRIVVNDYPLINRVAVDFYVIDV